MSVKNQTIIGIAQSFIDHAASLGNDTRVALDAGDPVQVRVADLINVGLSAQADIDSSRSGCLITVRRLPMRILPSP
jgi:hypothetical protein